MPECNERKWEREREREREKDREREGKRKAKTFKESQLDTNGREAFDEIRSAKKSDRYWFAILPIYPT